MPSATSRRYRVGPGGFLRDDAHGVGLPGSEANHLLLHQGLKTVLGEDSVEVLEDEAEEAFAGTAVKVKNGEGIACDSACDFTDGRRVQGFLVAKIVIEEGFVQRGPLRQ